MHDDSTKLLLIKNAKVLTIYGINWNKTVKKKAYTNHSYHQYSSPGIFVLISLVKLQYSFEVADLLDIMLRKNAI